VGQWVRNWPGIAAPILIDAAVLAGFVTARTLGSAVADGIWLVTAMIAAVRWPASGLGIAVAVALWPQQIRAGMTPGVAVAAASGVGFALAWALDRARARASPGPVRAVVVGAFALIAATFLALIHTQREFGPAIARVATLRWTESAVSFTVLVLGLRAAALGSMRPMLLTMAAMAAALAVAIVAALGPGVLDASPLHWMLSEADTSRASGPFASPNRLGTVAAVAAILGASLAWGGRGAGRWGAVACAGLGVAAVLLSYSRGALLGLVLAGGALVAARSRRAAFGYIVVAGVAAVVLVPLLLASRLAGSGGTLGALFENDIGRFDAWLAGIRMIIARPIFGQGFNAFQVLGASYGATDGLQTAHFEFIDLWAQAGIAAAAGYAAIVVGTVRGALDRVADPWAMASLGAIVVFGVASSFNVQSPFLAVMGPVWIVSSFGIGRPATPDDAAQPPTANRRLVP
jgi:O-antigen ligase